MRFILLLLLIHIGLSGKITANNSLLFSNEIFMITLDSVDVQPPDCAGFTNGSITVFVSGGVPPYHYLWNTGTFVDTFPTLTNRPAGFYEVAITDSGGSEPLITGFVIPEPPNIEISFWDIQRASCSGICNGSAVVRGNYSNGQAGNFEFFWEDGTETLGTTESTSIDLCEGWNVVSVTDGIACSLVDSVFIPTEFQFSLNNNETTVTDISCEGRMDGGIFITVQDGMSPYQFNWEDLGIGNNSRDNLAEGNYSVTVSDANNCQFDATFSVGQVEPMWSEAFFRDYWLCLGQGLSFNVGDIFGGGGPPYSFSVNNEEVFHDVNETIIVNLNQQELPYQMPLQLKDGAECVLDTSVWIEEIALLLDLPDSIVIDLGDRTYLNVVTNHFFPLEEIFWQPNNSLSCHNCLQPIAQPDTTTLYHVRIEDIQGCVATDNILVIVNKHFDYYLPKTFSADRDGINDKFRLFFSQSAEFAGVEMQFTIFSQWGNVLYNYQGKISNDISWDGRYNGKEVPEGTYYYILSIPEGKVEDKGYITLLRKD